MTKNIEKPSAMTDTRSSPGSDRLRLVYDALVQAQDCIRGETPEDVTAAEAREDTISKVRDAMRTIEAMQGGGVAQAAPKPVAHRWRQPGNKHWIYDPTPEWIEDHRHEIELQTLYASPPSPVAGETSLHKMQISSRNATIEECARVADRWGFECTVAAEIRSLSVPSTDDGSAA